MCNNEFCKNIEVTMIKDEEIYILKLKMDILIRKITLLEHQIERIKVNL